MERTRIAIGLILLAAGTAAFRGGSQTRHAEVPASLTVLADWSLEAQRAIVPPPAGVGDKFPGEAAVYMGIVHAAMYDAAVALHGGYRPYAVEVAADIETAPAAVIATAAHGVLAGLLPAQIGDLNTRYVEYLARIPDSPGRTNGAVLGQRVAAAVLAMRADDGRAAEMPDAHRRPGLAVFTPDPARPALGLRLSRIRPIALESPWQFRPAGPTPPGSEIYAADLEEVRSVGRIDSEVRTEEQTDIALFWTDHDVRQWNEGLLQLAAERGLDLLPAARMLALAHASGGDAMIACFDAKYHYMFWRPAAALMPGGADGKPRMDGDTAWRPLRPAPNHPEYPAAHTCHTSAIVESLRTFFGTDDVRLSLDSRASETTRTFTRLGDVVKEVEDARVYAGFHFRSSAVTGSQLGREVARFVAARSFRPVSPDGPGPAAPR